MLMSTWYAYSCSASSVIPVGPCRASTSPIYRSSTIIPSKSQSNSSVGRRRPNVSIIGLAVGLACIAFLLLGVVLLLSEVQSDSSVRRHILNISLIAVAIGLTCVAILLLGVVLIQKLFRNRQRMEPSYFQLGREDPEAAGSPNGMRSAEDSSASGERSSGSDGDRSGPEKTSDSDADHSSGSMCW